MWPLLKSGRYIHLTRGGGGEGSILDEGKLGTKMIVFKMTEGKKIWG